MRVFAILRRLCGACDCAVFARLLLSCVRNGSVFLRASVCAYTCSFACLLTRVTVLASVCACTRSFAYLLVLTRVMALASAYLRM